MMGLYPDAPDAGNVPFTDAAGRLLADARGESDRLRHEYIGTEHVVLALTQDTATGALLTRLGIDRDQVRAAHRARPRSTAPSRRTSPRLARSGLVHREQPRAWVRE